jgi:tetratricopeptide (TPR) repeat protein
MRQFWLLPETAMLPSFPNPRVFISYSHDSRDHCRRVLDLAQQLRRDGIAAELDQFHENELHHWPRWCEEQMRPENADFVLCVCTPEYRRRVEGRVPADMGKGVFWEGTLIYNQVYDAKNNRRCVPVLLDGAGEADIPAVLGGYTWFRLDGFGLGDAESGYARLYRLLTRQPGVVGAGVGEVVHLPSLPEVGPVTDFFDEMKKIREGVARIEQKGEVIHSEQIIHERKSRRRHGVLAVGLVAVLGVSAGGYWILPRWTAHEVTQGIDPAMIAERLRSEIQTHFERDAEAARRENKNWETIRELEKNRDAALSRVDEVVATIREGLAGNPGPIFKEATRILEKEGTDAALAYLESHRADILARADRSAALAESAQDKLKQDLQPLLLKADLHETRQEWNAALDLLQTVAAKAPGWWEARLRVGNLLEDLARYAEAEPHLRAAVALAVDEKDQARAINHLARLLQKTNQLREAELLLRRAVHILTNPFGGPYPGVVEAINNLGILLKNTNRSVKAEPLLRRALDIAEVSYGSEHPYVAGTLGNLAMLLRDTNRLAEAETLMRRALTIYEKNYGVDHPNLATPLNNLAQILRDTNRLTEAETLIRRALAIDEKRYGPEHPDVAIVLNNLAELLRSTNRLEEAELLYRRVLAILEKTLGSEHPLMAEGINNLVLLLGVTNRLAEAEPLMRRALMIDEKSYGPEHPKVAILLNNLAGLLQATSRLGEAEPLMKQALVIFLKFTHATGHEHPHLRDVFGNYKRLLEALRLDKTQTQARLASLGPEAGYGADEWRRLQAGL